MDGTGTGLERGGDPPEQDEAARQAAQLLPCVYALTTCATPSYRAPCIPCKARPAVAAALRERDERKCRPDAGRHYNYAGAAECECKLFVREMHLRERIAALEAEVKQRIETADRWLHKCQAAEAENERLRDLLERGADLTTPQEVEVGAWDIWEREARAALAGRKP